MRSEGWFCFFAVSSSIATIFGTLVSPVAYGWAVFFGLLAIQESNR